MIGFRWCMRKVYRDVEPISMQELKNAVNVLKNGKVAEINEIRRNLKWLLACDGMSMEDMLCMFEI